MDIKEKIEELVEAIKKDEALQELFKKDPIKAVEKVLGVDIPDDLVDKIVEGVKGKVALDKVSDIAGTIKKLF